MFFFKEPPPKWLVDIDQHLNGVHHRVRTHIGPADAREDKRPNESPDSIWLCLNVCTNSLTLWLGGGVGCIPPCIRQVFISGIMRAGTKWRLRFWYGWGTAQRIGRLTSVHGGLLRALGLISGHASRNMVKAHLKMMKGTPRMSKYFLRTACCRPQFSTLFGATLLPSNKAGVPCNPASRSAGEIAGGPPHTKRKEAKNKKNTFPQVCPAKGHFQNCLQT